MCLSNILGPFTANKDITVYKAVRKRKSVDKSYHGKPFTGVIKNIHVTGFISIDKRGICHLCTNDGHMSGVYTDEKFGMLYSWRMDMNVSSVLVDNEDVRKYVYITKYREYVVEMGETYASEISICPNEEGNDEIHKGLHSYKSSKDACDHNPGFYICTCIIPKGSTYYKGYFDRKESYASDCIKYIKIRKDVSDDTNN